MHIGTVKIKIQDIQNGHNLTILNDFLSLYNLFDRRRALAIEKIADPAFFLVKTTTIPNALARKNALIRISDFAVLGFFAC